MLFTFIDDAVISRLPLWAKLETQEIPPDTIGKLNLNEDFT